MYWRGAYLLETFQLADASKCLIKYTFQLKWMGFGFFVVASAASVIRFVGCVCLPFDMIYQLWTGQADWTVAQYVVFVHCSVYRIRWTEMRKRACIFTSSNCACSNSTANICTVYCSSMSDTFEVCNQHTKASEIRFFRRLILWL